MKHRLKKIILKRFPKIAYFGGTNCDMLAVGSFKRRDSFARALCGEDFRVRRSLSVTLALPEDVSMEFAKEGGVAVISEEVAHGFSKEFKSLTLQVPIRVGLSRDLPSSIEDLYDCIRTSTTREDLRRIRKANFSYRIERDPQVLSEFHTNYAAALVDSRFPNDGDLETVESLLQRAQDGSELICLDSDGEWLAGIFNRRNEGAYRLGRLGIRGGDEDVRRKHVTSALLVRSFERGVELGSNRATLGASIPFLGKGPIWFKAKWGGVLDLDGQSRVLVLLDIRHETIQQVLSQTPILHDYKGELAAAFWLSPGPEALKKLNRDVKMFQGVRRWHAFAGPETIAQGAIALSEMDGIVPVVVQPEANSPIWVGGLVRDSGNDSVGSSRITTA
jgi:hypothetical protein